MNKKIIPRFSPSSSCIALFCSLALAVSGGIAALPTAKAQTSNVIVDLSVLSNNTYLSSNIYEAPSYTGPGSGQLLMPGASNPTSSYFGPPVTVSKRRPAATVTAATPSSGTSPSSTLASNDTVPPPAPEPIETPEPVVEMAATAMDAGSETPEITAAPEPLEIEAEQSSETATPLVVDDRQAVSSEMLVAAEETVASEQASTPPGPPEEPEIVVEQSASENTMTATEETAESMSETETAAVTNGNVGIDPGRASRIIFQEGDVRLPEASKSDLATIASAVANNEDLRVQLMAYAGGEDLSSSKARRVSLSRALAVRSYLIEQGIRSTRIDVRALGDKTDEQPVNRVDVDITER